MGSARSDGNTRLICSHLQKHLKLSFYDLNDHSIGYYDYKRLTSDDDFIPLIKKLIDYDTWIFVTPVYWYSMSAQLKTFLDRFTDLLNFRKDLGEKLLQFAFLTV